MSILNVDKLANGTAVVDVGDDGGYVMVEHVKAGWIAVTVFNDEGDVLLEREFNTVAHPEMEVRDD